MAKKVGFVGVGTMGKPMASNLLKAGFSVTVCPHVNMERVNALKAEGAQVVANPKEVAAASEIVFICLPNAPEVEEVLFGANGLMAGAKPGLVIVDTSTISPIATQKFAAKVAEKGCTLLDAPMSGGEVGAIAGTLTFMVGGDKNVLAAHRAVFEAMGKKIYHVGGSGMGEVVKLCNNLMLSINLLGVCEAFTMGAKAGVDPAMLAEVVQASSGGSAVVERYVPKTILKNQYKPGFMLKLMAKDMAVALETARALGVPTFAGAIAGQVLDMMKSMGMGDDDFTVAVKMYENAAGITIGKGDGG